MYGSAARYGPQSVARKERRMFRESFDSQSDPIVDVNVLRGDLRDAIRKKEKKKKTEKGDP